MNSLIAATLASLVMTLILLAVVMQRRVKHFPLPSPERTGRVVTWGRSDPPLTIRVGRVVAIAASNERSFAILEPGTTIGYTSPLVGAVLGWDFDRDYDYEYDDGSHIGKAGMVAIAAGGHGPAFALDPSGVVYRAMSNSAIHDGREEGVPEGVLKLAVGGRGNSCLRLALMPDKTVFAWGPEGQLPVPASVRDITAIAVGGGFSGQALAVTQDGNVLAWTRDGELVATPGNLTDIRDIAAGHSHCVAVRKDGRLLAWGDNRWGQLDVPPGLTDVVQLAAGSDHTLALRSDGTVVAWGKGYSGQLDLPETLSNVISVAAGGRHSMALVQDPVMGAR